MLGGDQALGLELRVDGAAGVDVHPGEAGELADTRQAVVLTQGAARDHPPQPPEELGADRHLVVAVDLEVDEGAALDLVRAERQIVEAERPSIVE